MTAINLPNQQELMLSIHHKRPPTNGQASGMTREVQIAKLLRQYEDRPTSETWSRIQALAAEILK